MLNNTLRSGAVGAGAASRYGSGSDQRKRLLEAPAPQYCLKQVTKVKEDYFIVFSSSKREKLIPELYSHRYSSIYFPHQDTTPEDITISFCFFVMYNLLYTVQ
jgi:hypothetical protein